MRRSFLIDFREPEKRARRRKRGGDRAAREVHELRVLFEGDVRAGHGTDQSAIPDDNEYDGKSGSGSRCEWWEASYSSVRSRSSSEFGAFETVWNEAGLVRRCGAISCRVPSM